MAKLRHSKTSPATTATLGALLAREGDRAFAHTPQEATRQIYALAAAHKKNFDVMTTSPRMLRMPIRTTTTTLRTMSISEPRTRMAVAIHCNVHDTNETGPQNVFLAAYPETPENPKSPISFAIICGNGHLHGVKTCKFEEKMVIQEGYPNHAMPTLHFLMQGCIKNHMNKSMGCMTHVVYGTKKTLSCNHIIAAIQELAKEEKGSFGSLYKKTGVTNLGGLIGYFHSSAKADLKNLHEGEPLKMLKGAGGLPAGISSGIPDLLPKHNSPLTPEEQQLQDLVAIEQEHAQRGSFSKEVTRLISVANYKPARVLVVGPAGVGKSNTLRTMGTDTRLFPGGYHEIQLMPDTEPKDLLGGYYPTVNQETKQKNYEYVDGPLIAAMQAAKEQRTMLNLEEIGNAPHLTRIFKGLFNPHDGKYTLNIDKPEAKDRGIFGLTSVSCPVQNLVVVGSANAGDGYSLDLGDRAVRDRFVILRYGIDRDLLCRAFRGSDEAKEKLLEYRTDEQKAIFAIFTPRKGHSHDAKFCDYAKIGILQVSTEVQEAVMKGEVEAPLSIRAIAETAQITPPNDRDAFVANLKMYGQNSARMLPDGTIMLDQVQKMNDIIDQFL